jgi:EmrB/QacA subfamily drug resistance transporter
MRSPIPAEAPRVTKTVPHRWFILAIVAAAQLMVVLDATIVTIALPSAQADLGFDAGDRQWIITAYSLAFGSLLLLGGRLSDIAGRKRTLIIGLLGFAAASTLGGAAGDFTMLVIARSLQGTFAAILAPAALSALNVTFTDTRERARALAVYAAVASSGAVLGLILGGVLTEWLSWRWCLYVNVAFAVPAAMAALAFVAAEDGGERSRRVDIPGVVAVSGGLFCLVYGLANAETHGWNDPVTVTMLIGSAVLLAAFIAIEKFVREPLLPLRILADRNRAGAYLALALGNCALFGAFLFLTYYFQQNLAFSPLKAGAAFLPLAAGIGIAAAVANTTLVPRFGPRPLISLGMLICAGSMYRFAHLSVESSYANGILGPLFTLGLGLGLSFAPAISAASTRVARRDAGVASAMVNTSQQIGGTVGAAALSTISIAAMAGYLANRAPSGPDAQAAAAVHGYAAAFWFNCALFLVGAILTAMLLRSGPLPAEEAPGGDQTTPPAA